MPKRTPIATPRPSLVLGAALLLVGCGPTVPPGGVGATASPSTSASALPSPQPSGSSSSDPTASGASPAPVVSATPKPVTTLSVSGTVYDLEGAPVDKATVTVNSLDNTQPFTATVSTISGSYVVRGVPEGLTVEIVASRSGWTSRRRTAAFDAAGLSSVVDFGGPPGADDREGAAHFISRYPEIASITPAADSAELSRDLQSLVVKLSEPLDADNRKRLEDGLRLLPANGVAAPGRGVGLARDLTQEPDGRNWLPASEWAYAIAKGVTFLGDTATKAEVTWNSAGDEATFAWKAPLAVGKDEGAKYQLALSAGATRIVDAEGLQLGTDKDGNQTAYPAEGNLVHHAFREPNLALGGSNPTPAKRWANTHSLSVGFRLVRDAQAPKLLSISQARVGENSRLELLFNEPLTVFDGTTKGYADASVAGEAIMGHLHFAVAKRADLLNNLTLNGKAADAVVWNPQTQATFGSNSEQERAFRIDATAFSSLAPSAETTVGKVCVTSDPLNPSKLLLHFIGRPNIFTTEATHIRVRAEGIADPAGNRIEKSQADSDQIISKI